jgi:hypothetical protein
MTSPFTRCTERNAPQRRSIGKRSALMALAAAMFAVCCLTEAGQAHADSLARANAAYASGDYVRAVNILTPLAFRGNASAQALNAVVRRASLTPSNIKILQGLWFATSGAARAWYCARSFYDPCATASAELKKQPASGPFAR